MSYDMQHICYEMDNKAYGFMEFQKDYYSNKADDIKLMEKTTQPFWQSMRLSKRRLTSKGLTMEVDLTRDAKSKTILDERTSVRKDGHHLAGNKTLNVIAQRKFYKNGKKLFAEKNREICNFSLLKTEVQGERAACPNCGYVDTITSFMDGCDACDAKFTVQDFETKISGYSLEENTSAKIKDTVLKNIKLLVCIIGGFILLGIVMLVISAMRLLVGNTGINMVATMMGLYMAITMVPITFRLLIILAAVFAAGTSYLLSIYKNPILNENIVKSQLPEFSARDFYQNLEYKLRNIHLTDKVEEVSVFAHCSLNDIVKDYQDVVECDMTRLKFLQFGKESDGYRANVEAELRLTECRKNRIVTKYEKVNLLLSGKEEIVNKSVATLREYKCSSCGSSLNVLEGGRCTYCGNVFDYSQFGWVIEEYQGQRRPISLYQFIKYVMLTIFVIVFGLNILFPIGFGRENIFQMYDILSQQNEQLEQIITEVKLPDMICEGVTELSRGDFLLERNFEYRAADPDTVMAEYRSYLEEMGFVLYEETENSYTMYKFFRVDYDPDASYYRIVVTKVGSNIIIVKEDMPASLLEE